MTNQTQNSAQLEDHTFQFAQAVREFGKRLPNTVSNVEDLRELVRASGQVGALYLQSKSASSRQMFVEDIRSCAQQAQTTHYWLRLVDLQGNQDLENQRTFLLKIAKELVGVFTQIIQKSAA